MRAKEEKSFKVGAICFFDIQGYRSMMKNNDSDDYILKVVEMLSDETLKQTGQEAVIKMIKETLSQLPASHVNKDIINIYESIVRSINTISFSDSILFTLEFKEAGEKEDRVFINYIRWNVFLFYAKEIFNYMFDIGLPVKGGMSFGKYLIDEKNFAGSGIVDAYEMCEKIDLIGCVLDEKTSSKHLEDMNKFSKIISKETIEHFFCVEYRVPSKNGEEMEVLVLNTICEDDMSCDMDFRDKIIKSFSGFNKKIPKTLDRRIRNSVKLLEYLASQSKIYL